VAAYPALELVRFAMLHHCLPNPEEADPTAGAAGPHACTYGSLLSAVKEATGKAWLKT